MSDFAVEVCLCLAVGGWRMSARLAVLRARSAYWANASAVRDTTTSGSTDRARDHFTRRRLGKAAVRGELLSKSSAYAQVAFEARRDVGNPGTAGRTSEMASAETERERERTKCTYCTG